MLEYNKWKHVFKLDPNKEINDEQLERVCESGTDAIIVGGTDGVTLENTLNLLSRIRRYSVTCALEISNKDAISPGFDYYFIPSVLNSEDIRWVNKLHHEALKDYGVFMNWDEIVMEGYCVLNADSKVAKLTQANTKLSQEDVIAYAQMAEHMYRFPIFYLEYSGTYGDVKMVEQTKKVLKNTRLFYGGGIKSVEQAREMAQFADTVVVGNVLYENLTEALATVDAV